MRVSKQQMAEHRQKILEAASRLFRERGFDDVSVAEVMKAAGLTHGGFYGHFKSKDDLISQALTHALDDARADDAQLPQFIARYVSSEHCQNIAGGCAIAALGVETARQGPEARAAMTAGLRRRLELFTERSAGKGPKEKRRAAIGTSAAMLGAVILARLADDPQLSDEILSQTRAWLELQRKAGS
jgi:TetR/AcrR family transcriptional repressor of nem operon